MHWIQQQRAPCKISSKVKDSCLGLRVTIVTGQAVSKPFVNPFIRLIPDYQVNKTNPNIDLRCIILQMLIENSVGRAPAL